MCTERRGKTRPVELPMRFQREYLLLNRIERRR